MVLIKQFKNGGPLHGSIGLITLGIWTFIWGWMKHKGLYLTKVMIVYTALIIIPVALVGVFGFGIVNEVITSAKSLTGDKKDVKKTSAKKSTQPKKTAQKSTYQKSAKSTKTTYSKTASSPKTTARKTTYNKTASSRTKTGRTNVEQYHQTLSDEGRR